MTVSERPHERGQDRSERGRQEDSRSARRGPYNSSSDAQRSGGARTGSGRGRPAGDNSRDRGARAGSDRERRAGDAGRFEGRAGQAGDRRSSGPRAGGGERAAAESISRPSERIPSPEIPDDVTFAELDKAARGRLRTLSKDNAQRVGQHLVMAGRLIDIDPELAYEHAQAALRRAGRVDVVREAAGLTAYRTARYGEALRELRTVRRLNGSSEHLALMADCERGLGRPERALALAASAEAQTLGVMERVELAIVVSGARTDLGEYEAALAVLPTVPAGNPVAVRVAEARAAVLTAAGRTDEAAQILAGLDLGTDDRDHEEEIVVYDLAEDVALDESDSDRHDLTAGRGNVGDAPTADGVRS